MACDEESADGVATASNDDPIALSQREDKALVPCAAQSTCELTVHERDVSTATEPRKSEANETRARSVGSMGCCDNAENQRGIQAKCGTIA
jgi:hypothetical protein